MTDFESGNVILFHYILLWLCCESSLTHNRYLFTYIRKVLFASTGLIKPEIVLNNMENALQHTESRTVCVIIVMYCTKHVEPTDLMCNNVKKSF